MSDEGSTGGDIWTVPAAGGEAKNRTPDMKASASALFWRESGEILFTEYVEGDEGISTLDSSGKLARLWRGSATVKYFCVARRSTASAAVHSSFREPYEIFAGPIGEWKPMSVNLFSEDAFAGERGHWMGSARLGFLKYALNLLEPDETDLDPRYYDAFVRGQYSASPSISLFGNLLAAQDDIRQHASDKVQNLDSTTRDLYGWVGADTVVGSTLFAQTIASAGRLTRERRGNFENSGVVGNVADVRSFRFAGGSQTWTARVSDSNEARFGLAGKHVSAAYEYDSRREIQVPSNPPPPIVRHLEPDPSGTDLSVWGSDRVRLFPNVTMSFSGSMSATRCPRTR